MKIKKEHLDRIKQLCDTVIEKAGGIEKVKTMYETGSFPRSDRVKDLNMRFRFDVFYAAMQLDSGFTNELYEYLTDDHIHTAMKRTVPNLEKRY